MANVIIWTVLAILILALLLAIIVTFVTKKRKRRGPDYYAFFWMGIIWLGFGIPFKMYALSVIGLVFMIIGLVNKKSGKRTKRTECDGIN